MTDTNTEAVERLDHLSEGLAFALAIGSPKVQMDTEDAHYLISQVRALAAENARLRADREGSPPLTQNELVEFRRAHPLNGLALVALSAWVNVRPDRLPASMQAHNCPATMTAWARVADAVTSAALAAERDAAWQAGYLAGFNASSEGWNGEYPFGDDYDNAEEDEQWVKDRDAALAAFRALPLPGQPKEGET